MRLVKAQIKGYRSIIDSGCFTIETGKTILVGPNEAGKTAILQALQKLNPPDGVELFNPLRDYPRSMYNEDITREGINPQKFVVVMGWFDLEKKDKDLLPESYNDVTFIYGRNLDNSAFMSLENGPKELIYSNIKNDLVRIKDHYVNNCSNLNNGEVEKNKIEKEFQELVANLQMNDILVYQKALNIKSWLEKNINFLEETNTKENERYNKLLLLLENPEERKQVLEICEKQLPKFILFSNYFRIRPILHLKKLVYRIENKVLDDSKYDYGNLCLFKFLGLTPKELSDLGKTEDFDLNNPTSYKKFKDQLDSRDYKLNSATIRLTQAIEEVWNPKIDNRDANKLRIKVDGQYLKVVVEDELGVEIELDQRSEGFQWIVSFYIVFFSEATDKHKNSILLLDEPGLSLHALKQSEFKETLSKLSASNQTIFTTHSPFLVGANELDKVRIVEMVDRRQGTKVNLSLTATDSGAMLPLQEALGYDLAQSLFFHKKNLVLEGLTDMWYLEGLSELLIAEEKIGLDDKISLLPSNGASGVVYFATILHAQNLKVAALLDSDAAGDKAAKQDSLVNALGNKRIIRTKDVYKGNVVKVEIEDILRDTLIKLAKKELGWDIITKAQEQNHRPIVDVFESVLKKDFSKYKLAKAFLKWSRYKKLSDLTENEIKNVEELIKKINSALS